MRHPLTGETIASFSEHLCRRCGFTMTTAWKEGAPRAVTPPPWGELRAEESLVEGAIILYRCGACQRLCGHSLASPLDLREAQVWPPPSKEGRWVPVGRNRGCPWCGGTEVAEFPYPPIPNLCPACGERALGTTRNWLM